MLALLLNQFLQTGIEKYSAWFYKKETHAHAHIIKKIRIFNCCVVYL